MHFEGNSILITGASGWIGRAYVKRFSELGFKVYGQVNTGKVEGCEIIRCDLSVAGSGSKLIQNVGNVDYIINNAANQKVLDQSRAPISEVNLMMRINVEAPREIIAAASLTETKVILNISSVEARHPRSGHEIYGASKAALEQLTIEASRKYPPMRVLGLRLGLIGRPDIEQKWPEGVAAWKAATPLGRYATAEEVVKVSEFLLSDENSFATGSIYDFDGGLGDRSW